jgi:hypothetical protein
MVHNVEHWYSLVPVKEPYETSHIQESASPSERKLALREAFYLRYRPRHSLSVNEHGGRFGAGAT